jgi:hypothetical protein
MITVLEAGGSVADEVVKELTAKGEPMQTQVWFCGRVHWYSVVKELRAAGPFGRSTG